jgi:hypothetical protein
MANYTKDVGSKTTIWKDGSGGKTLVATLPGLPCGVPKLGEVVYVPNFGKAECSGITQSGSGINQTVDEVQLTIK